MPFFFFSKPLQIFLQIFWSTAMQIQSSKQDQQHETELNLQNTTPKTEHHSFPSGLENCLLRE